MQGMSLHWLFCRQITAINIKYYSPAKIRHFLDLFRALIRLPPKAGASPSSSSSHDTKYPCDKFVFFQYKKYCKLLYFLTIRGKIKKTYMKARNNK